MNTSATPSRPIRLVLSDVDGTLVTHDKKLTSANVAAVDKLRRAGIGFTITSARPPQGLAMLTGPLGITLPIAGFNGGLFMTPSFEPIEERRIGGDVAAQVLRLLDEAGVSAWLFTAQDWIVRDVHGPKVDHEEFTIGYPPKVVPQFDDSHYEAAIKIVGVSDDHAGLADLESAAHAAFGASVSASRSQVYYLDFTHPTATKGTVVERLAAQLAFDPAEIATIGDSANDVAMFEKAGFAIAMGNANEAVRSRANAVTGTNEESGFAMAIERYILA